MTAIEVAVGAPRQLYSSVLAVCCFLRDSATCLWASGGYLSPTDLAPVSLSRFAAPGEGTGASLL